MHFLGSWIICNVVGNDNFGSSFLVIGLVIPIHRPEAIPKTEFDAENSKVSESYLRSHNWPT